MISPSCTHSLLKMGMVHFCLNAETSTGVAYENTYIMFDTCCRRFYR